MGGVMPPGRYDGGVKKTPTQSDVAAAAGVSRGLVSLALSGSPMVARETAQRIREVAEQMGYRVNAQASALASRHTGIIGLVLPNLLNPFFDAIAQSLQVRAREADLSLLTVLEGDGALDTLERLRAEGIIMVSSTLGDEKLRELGARVPLCVIGSPAPGGLVDAVRVDEAEAARVVIDHLVARGVTRLVYVPGSEEGCAVSERESALREAAAACAVPIATAADGQIEAGVEGQRIGIVAHNDLVAIDLASRVRGVCPLVSYDDTFLASRPEFDLTSVAQPTEVMASLAIERIQTRIGGEGSEGCEERIRPRLTERSSSRMD